MLTMQYRFELPAGHPMDSVRQRVRARQHLFLGYPGLCWKAFLLSEQGVGGAEVNAYAPLYLWERPEAALEFLRGPLFAAVTQAFSWAPVRFNLLASSVRGPAQAQAHTPRWCTTRTAPVPDCAALARLGDAVALAQAACHGRHVTVDPVEWTAREFVFWTEAPQTSGGALAYEVAAFVPGSCAVAPR